MMSESQSNPDIQNSPFNLGDTSNGIDDKSKLSILFQNLSRKFQNLLDRLTPHLAVRWVIFTILIILFFIRVYKLQGFYVVAYVLGIFLLNQFIAFLTPQFDPAESGMDSGLPTTTSDEFRPFARRLPEFKFWLSSCQAVFYANIATLFSIFDTPVYWPVLLFYFIILTAMTLKKQIEHMIKYRYIPFSFGKKKFNKDSKNNK